MVPSPRSGPKLAGKKYTKPARIAILTIQAKGRRIGEKKIGHKEGKVPTIQKILLPEKQKSAKERR